MQVECKKAQPKEAVLAANTAALLGKRVILSNLGVMPSLCLSPEGGYSHPSPPTPHQQVLSIPLLQAAISAPPPLGRSRSSTIGI